MKYTAYSFLFPPRPETLTLSSMLDIYEKKKKYVAQIKKNGTGSIIAISPDKEFFIKTRHGSDHKAWSPPEGLLDPFRRLPARWYYFCFELLHNKTKDIKNTMYIHDILVSNNNYLIDTKYIDRYNLLHKLFKVRGACSQYTMISDNIWIANNYNLGFENLFKSLSSSEDEGLVLKDPQAELRLCSKENSNSFWQVKCRRL